jgi:hypothetical protein
LVETLNRDFAFWVTKLLVESPSDKLAKLSVLKNAIYAIHDGRSIGIMNTAHLVALFLLFGCLFVSFDGFAKPASSPNRETLNQQIQFHDSRPRAVGRRAFSQLEEDGPDRTSGVVEFFPLVSSDGKPVTNQKTNQKREHTEKGILNYLPEELKEWIHLLATPLLWFVLGVILGGGFLFSRR